MSSIIRDTNFRELTRVRIDSKRRIGIPKAAKQDAVDSYSVYINDIGQIVLDPQVTIPAAEAWLYKNPEALKGVCRGLEEAKAGKFLKRGSFAKYAKEKLD